MAFVNPLNTTTQVGKILESEKIPYNFYPSKTGDDKSDLMMGKIDVYEGYKDKDGNPVMYLLPFKAWGNDARFMRDYIHRGDKIIISGSLRVDKNNVNGTNVYVPYISVVAVKSLSSNSENAGGNASSTSAKPASSTNPFAGKAVTNPFAKRNALK